MIRALLPSLLILAAALPAAASAATVGLDHARRCVPAEVESICSSDHTVTVKAAAGEANAMTIRHAGDELVVADAGALLTAGAGCAQATPVEVRCPFALVPEPGYTVTGYVNADTGDQADRITFVGHPARAAVVTIVGGAGDDTIELGDTVAPQAVVRGYGALGDDTVTGGLGPQVLDGGPGTDALLGGPGDDTLDGGLGDDRIDGGDGGDTVSYFDHETSIAVDLADPGPDGAPGERDRLAAIEHVTGSEHANVLRGDDGPNRLDAPGTGADRVEGRGGDDVLTAGPGRRDVVSGGAGADRIEAPAARVRCGAGRADTIVVPQGDVLARPPADCERAGFARVDVDLRPVAVRRRSVVVRVHGPQDHLVGRARLATSPAWRRGRDVSVRAGFAELVTLPRRGTRLYDSRLAGLTSGVALRMPGTR